jgi:hypothetical protein
MAGFAIRSCRWDPQIYVLEKRKALAWELSFTVADLLAVSGTGINQQITASNKQALTSTALASTSQPENVFAIDPSRRMECTMNQIDS